MDCARPKFHKDHPHPLNHISEGSICEIPEKEICSACGGSHRITRKCFTCHLKKERKALDFYTTDEDKMKVFKLCEYCANDSTASPGEAAQSRKRISDSEISVMEVETKRMKKKQGLNSDEGEENSMSKIAKNDENNIYSARGKR